MSMERTVKVTGKAKIAVRPDRIRLMITAKGEKVSYEEALGSRRNRQSFYGSVLKDWGFRGLI